MKKNITTATSGQIALDLGVEVQRDVHGIEMGVLENGIPFLTQRGLALAAGAPRKGIQEISQEWVDHFNDDFITKDRISFIRRYLFERGYTEPKLYIETVRDGTAHYAYPDVVCTAIIEYYAFESRSPSQQAIDTYRRFASYGLQRFIYDSLNYTPADKWHYHNDRVSMLSDSAPDGFFTIFREITGMIVDLINADLAVNHKTVPDISVGQHWARFWKDNNLAEQYGQRTEYEHNYPGYYPQSMSNPQRPYAYPDAALPAFRAWFKAQYLPTKFPTYILKKSNILPGGKEEALRIAGIFKPAALPPR